MQALIPGKRGIIVFLATAVVGLAVWAVSTPSVIGRLFGEGAYVAAYSHPLLRFFGLPLLAIVVAVAGYLSPRGFWLWGIAVVFLHPVARARQTERANSLGAFGSSGTEGLQLLGLALVTAMIIFELAVACMIAAALGAGLRLLWWWLRGKPIGRPGAASGDGLAR